MKKYSLLLIALSMSSLGFTQFSVGHTTITYNDPARTGGFGSGGGTGRQIQTEIYYPADVAGTDVNVSSGEFPIIVFGHGFAMAWDAYENIWETLVPEGFIIAFPRTEGSLIPAPSHQDYGLDLALVETELESANLDAASLFYNHISGKSAIMGHSMGGGSTILAAANNSSITTIIGLAPAETTPSAITDAANVSVPALIFSADQDMVTPAIDHHTPIYNDLNSSCKYFVNIIGGAHCYYANSNINCDFGESTSGGNISISRQEQQTIMFKYVIPWLKIYLYDDCDEHSVFESDLQQDADVDYQSSCTSFPSPSYDLNVSLNQSTLSADENNAVYQWMDCSNGGSLIPGATNQTYTATQDGDYAVILGAGSCADTSACYTITTTGITAYQQKDKKVIKIIDMLGRETEYRPNVPLIYIYEDGSRERRVVVED